MPSCVESLRESLRWRGEDSEELISATVITELPREGALWRRAEVVSLHNFSDAYEDEPGLHQGAAAPHGAAA